MARASLRRFALVELALWASIYPAYLAVRSATIGNPAEATAHALQVVDLERGVSLMHERGLQHLVSFASRFFSTYYLVGFAPLVAATLIWLGLRHRDRYRELRTLLFASLAIAILFYVLYPTAPPRLVPTLGLTDTVGMSAHDTGSFLGVRLNPYAAMPSMHVGWSLLVGLIGFRVARRPLVRALFAVHPILMALTVTATGNHYFLDSIVGIAVALTALAIVSTSWSRLAGLRPQPTLGIAPCSSH
jgi:hypothetical protein